MRKNLWGNVLLIVAFLWAVWFVGGRVSAFVSGLVHAPEPEHPPGVEVYDRMTPVEIGQMLFDTQGCQSCHILGLVGGPIGPSLSNVGTRRSEQWLRDHFLDTEAVVPGNDMPSYDFLSDTEIDGLVAYMRSLDGSRQGPETQGPINLDPPERFTQAQIARGQEVYAAQGCSACHVIGGEGGNIGPDLTHEGLRKRTDEWQKQHLKDPVSVYVYGPTEGISWPMPSFANLSDDDLDALVAYLQSLR